MNQLSVVILLLQSFSGIFTTRANAATTSSVPQQVTPATFLNYFQLGGSATYDQSTGIVTLTQDKQYQVGNFTLKNRISLDQSFELQGEAYLGSKLDSQGGADGIGFAFHTDNVGTVGYDGNNLGIGGLTDAYGFKLDSYRNGIQVPYASSSNPSYRLGWDADPSNNPTGTEGHSDSPFGALVNTNSSTYATTVPSSVQYLDKSLVLNPSATFLPITFSYDGNSHVLTVTYAGLTWSETITSSASLAMAISASTGNNSNLQQFKFISFSYTAVTRIAVQKDWVDNQNQDGIRPSTVSVSIIQTAVDGTKQTYTTGTIDAANGWYQLFDNLPKLDSNGQPFTYSVVETPVPNGYTSSVVPAIETATITKTHTPEVTSYTGTKHWSDNNNQDGFRPASIIVNLLADGEQVSSQTVSAATGWTYTFNNLPKYANGQLINYSVSENAVAQYTPTYTDNDITNTHTPEQINISGTKTWNDANNQDGIRPNSITVNLLADGNQVSTTQATAATNWQYSFNNLDKYKNGQLINYTITENAVPGYTTTVNNFDVTNSYTPKTTSVSGIKTWNDGNNQDGKRPNSISVNLLANGTKVDSKTVTSADQWAYSFDNLPEYENGTKITYTITEDAIAGYSSTVNGYDITNSYTPGKVNYTISKIWDDANNQDGKRPSSISVQLYKDGVASGNPVTIDNTTGWTHVWNGLDEMSSGKTVTYTASEVTTPPTYTETTDFTNPYNGIITNTHVIEKTNVNGTKTWDDANNQDGKRPGSITVNLLADGQVVQSKSVSATDNWKYTFDNLDKYKNGQEISYSITENTVADYSTSIDGYNVTNHYTPRKTSVTVTKSWNDGNNQDKIRPNEVKVQLYANGVALGEPVALDAKVGWTKTWSDLNLMENGEAISYTVKEVNVPKGYTAKVDNQNAGNIIITNTHQPKKVVTTPPTKPTKPGQTNTNSDSKQTLPKTGDNANFSVSIIGGIILFMGFLLFLQNHKRKDQ